MVSLIVLVLIAIACFRAPYLGLRAPEDRLSPRTLSIPPDFELGYYFGTDAKRARSLRAHALWRPGLADRRLSSPPSSASIIGAIWGATAGFFGGRVDGMMMRIVDILYSHPLHLLRDPARPSCSAAISC